jgi:hypothetical protein
VAYGLSERFDEKELVDLTLAVVGINGWNRLAIAFGTPAATYQPAQARVAGWRDMLGRVPLARRGNRSR